jgi:ribosome biogenesis GTPase A
MPVDSLTQRSRQLTELAALLDRLDGMTRGWPLPALETLAWYGELQRKLLPQLDGEPYLIAAVCGGTNTGKSVIFNHLVGARLSEAHAEATQTKHPVCCLPQGFAESHDLQRIFPDFRLREWSRAGDALQDDVENLLFMRTDPSGQQPANLLLLDTPDVDGILSDNHRRAELIRHSADVLVAVLTQQKYNDAVVRDFFREAVRADKTLLIVFNMVHLPEQAATSRKWLATFSESTGCHPQAAYLAPYDYQAAERLVLDFQPLSPDATNPRQDLSQLQFTAIKLRSLQGSLDVVLDEEQGLPRYMQDCLRVSYEYREAYEILAREVQVPIHNLPQVPSELLWDEIWSWLAEHRKPWERMINQTLSWPSRMIAKLWQSSPKMNLEEYRRREWDAFQAALSDYLTRLDGFRRGGNALIQRALESANLSINREQLFADLQTQYQSLPLLTEDYRQFVRAELEAFAVKNPKLLKGFTLTLQGTAVVRPIAMLGLGYFGAHAVDLAGGHLLNMTGDVVVGATAAISGEGLVAGMMLPVRELLSRIFSHYYTERAALLAKMLHERVLGDSIVKLKEAADLPESPWWNELQKLVHELRVTAS